MVDRVGVAADETGLRLDRWFRRRYPDLGHGALEKLLRTGQVRVDGRRAKAGQRLEAGQEVRVPPFPEAPPDGEGRRATPRPLPPVSAGEAADLRARVLHKDDAVIVLDKPAGLPVQGGSGTTRHLDGMLDVLRFDAAERPRLVHRLDKDTSGVLVLARTAAAAAALAEAFRSREAHKIYWAVVVGVPKPEEGRIAAPLAKLPGRNGERVVVDEDDGKGAVTDYRVLEIAAKRAAWVELEPHTGRTHQLRAHCALLGTPILGDGKYGAGGAFLSGGEVTRKLHLHARAIIVPHPVRGVLRVEAPLPPHMRETFRFFGFSQ